MTRRRTDLSWRSVGSRLGSLCRRHLPGTRRERGFLYAAVGQSFAEEAVRSIKSLRANGNHEPVALFTDQAVPPLTDVSITVVRSTGNGYLDKITCIAATPFERTVYLDTDTIIADSIAEIFELTNRFDIAAAHAPGYRGMPESEVPDAFFELNTGVLAYRWSRPMDDFLVNWRDGFREGIMHSTDDPRFAQDQPTFRRCLWLSSLKIYVLPPEYNYRFIFPGFSRDRVKVFHGRHDNVDEIIAAINARCENGPRIFEATPRTDSGDAP
jgi:hypothetical protein